MPRYKNVTNKVDHVTGDIVEEVSIYTIKVKTDKFYMGFFGKEEKILEVKSLLARNILDLLFKHVHYNTGIIHISTGLRHELMEKLKANSPNFSRALKSLIDADLLLVEARGVYKLNPDVFWVGESKERTKYLKR